LRVSNRFNGKIEALCRDALSNTPQIGNAFPLTGQ
jgi:hypothetical protein